MRTIVPIASWSAALDSLVEESEQEGFRFLGRLRDDWHSGANRFAGRGKAFFGVYEGDRLLAVGGVSRDSDECGRLRRCDVKSQERGRGIGRLLVSHLLRFASLHY